MSANKKSIQIGLGISSILMIFVVLCMSVLSLLTYREATQKMDITKRQQAYQEAYAQADASMQFALIQLQESQYGSFEEMLADVELQSVLTELQIQLEEIDNSWVLTKTMENEQILQVTLMFQENRLTIMNYQSINEGANIE